MLKLSIVSVFMLTSFLCLGQTSQFKKGQIDLNVGVGFVTPLFNITGFDVKTKTPPISIAGSYGINDQVSVGLYVASAKSDVYGDVYDPSTFGYKYYKISTLNHLLIGGRVLYHYGLMPKFDTYAGGMLGYNVVKINNDAEYDDDSQFKVSGFTYSVLVGGRYRFTKNIGAFLELGYGVSVFNLGLNVKL